MPGPQQIFFSFGIYKLSTIDGAMLFFIFGRKKNKYKLQHALPVQYIHTYSGERIRHGRLKTRRKVSNCIIPMNFAAEPTPAYRHHVINHHRFKINNNEAFGFMSLVLAYDLIKIVIQGDSY